MNIIETWILCDNPERTERKKNRIQNHFLCVGCSNTIIKLLRVLKGVIELNRFLTSTASFLLLLSRLVVVVDEHISLL